MWWSFTVLANPYLPAEATPVAVEKDPFVWQVPEVSPTPVVVSLTIPEGYAVYRDALSITAVQGTIGEPVFPEARLAPDPSEPGRFRALYDGPIQIQVPAEPGKIVLEVAHQGCRKGLCWPRTTSRHEVVVWKK